VELVKVTKLKPHPLNESIYGEQEADAGLIESIKNNGIMEPLVIKEDGTIMSGHRRWRAAKAIGLVEVPCRVVGYSDELEEQEALIEFNRQREKTFIQKMKEAEKLKEIESEKARRRQIELAGNRPNTSSDLSATLREGGKGKTSEKLADAIGMKPRTFEKAAKVWEAAKQGNEVAEKLIEKLDKGEKTINAAYMELKRVEKQKELQAPPPPRGKYRVIYADPPWRYSNSGFAMSAENQYPTMETEEICKLPVEELALDNSVLFLWATAPMLEDVFKVIKAWGFTYKSNFVWVKDKHTGGFYCYGQHELLLIATKGSMLPKKEGMRASVVFAERREHSKKPEEFYDIIESMYDGPYIELFARDKRDGWEGWGAEYGI
jgi:ParB/RepB/Spo0J family partition protein